METFVIMIIIGIVSVVFRKGKEKPGRSRNKTFSMNTFEEIKTLVKKQLNNDEFPTPSTLKSKYKPSRIPLDHLENKYEQLKQEPEVKRIGISVAQPKVEKVEVNTGQDDGNLISFYPDEKTLINGMVWSEILGEPRSKKPFLPRKG